MYVHVAGAMQNLVIVKTKKEKLGKQTSYTSYSCMLLVKIAYA